MGVNKNIVLPKGATLIQEPKKKDSEIVLPKGATLIEGSSPPVKKKEDGGDSPSVSNSPSPSPLQGVPNDFGIFGFKDKNNQGNKITTPDGATLSIDKNKLPDIIQDKDAYLQDVQNRINKKEHTDQDVGIIANATGKSDVAVRGYLTNKMIGYSVEDQEAAAKDKSTILNSVNQYNKAFGTEYNPEEVLASADKSAEFFNHLKTAVAQKGKKDADLKMRLASDPQGVSVEMKDGKPVTVTNEQRIQELDSNNINDLVNPNSLYNQIVKYRDLVRQHVVKQTISEDQKNGIPSDKTIVKIAQRLDPEGFKRSVSASLPTPINPLNNIQAVGEAYDALFGTQDKQDLLNIQKGEAEIQYNRGVSELASNKISEGILSGNEGLVKEGQGELKQIDNEVIYKYPALLKRQMAQEVSETIGRRSGQLQGTETEGVRGYAEKVFGADERDYYNTMRELGYLDDPKRKDAAMWLLQHPSYFSDASYLGGIAPSFIKPFQDLGLSIGGISGFRSNKDIEASRIKDEQFPAETPGLKTSASVTRNIVNTTSNLLGMATIAAATEGIGANAGLSTAASKSLGAYASFGLPSWDAAYKESGAFLESDAARGMFATMTAVLNAEGGRLLDLGKITRIPGVSENFAKIAEGLNAKTITKEVANELLEEGKNKYVDFAVKYGKNVSKGAATMAYFSASSNILKATFGDPNTNIQDLVPQASHAFMDGVMGMSIMGAFGAAADMRRENNTSYKGFIYDMAVNHDAAADVFKLGLENGMYSKENYTQKMAILNAAKTSHDILNLAEKEQNTQLSPEQRSVYVANKTAEAFLKTKLEHTDNPFQKEKLDGQIARLDVQNKDIFNGLKFNETLEPLHDLFEAERKYDNALQDIQDGTITDKQFEAVKKEYSDLQYKYFEKGDRPEVKDDPISKAKEAITQSIKEGKLGVYAEQLKDEKNIKPFLKEVADQVYGLNEDGSRSMLPDAEGAAREQYGDAVVDAAKEMFPDGKEAVIEPEPATKPFTQQQLESGKELLQTGIEAGTIDKEYEPFVEHSDHVLDHIRAEIANGKEAEMTKEFGKEIVDLAKGESTNDNGLRPSFEDAKEGDTVLHNGQKVIVVGKIKSRNGSDVIEVQRAPKTAEELELDAASTVARNHADEYPKGVTVDEIKRNHPGEFQNTLSDAQALENSRTSSTYTLDKDSWDNDVVSSEGKEDIVNGEASLTIEGGAKPPAGESPEPVEKPKPEPTTGIKNKVTAEERSLRGLEEVEVEARRGFQQVWDTAKQMVDEGKRDPRVMAEELAAKPRALSPEESAMLVYDRMKLYNEHEDAVDQLIESRKTNDPDLELEAVSRMVYLEDAIRNNDEAARKTGYEQGLGLAIRRLLTNRDYSLANQKRLIEAEYGGEIPKEVKDRLKKYDQELKEANKKLQEYEEKWKEQQAAATVTKLKKEAEREAKKEGRKAKKEDLKTERDDLLAQLKKAKEDEEKRTGKAMGVSIPNAAIPIFAKLAKNYIKDGFLTLEEIVDRVFEDVKDSFEGISKREVRDAISGYGMPKKERENDIQKQLNEVKSQAKLISSIEDANEGQTPKKGAAPSKPSSKVKELRGQLAKAMKENGIDIDRSPKTAEEKKEIFLKSVKSRLQGQIDDLEKQIKTGEKKTQGDKIEYDEAAKDLMKERDRLKEILKDKDAPVDQQILNIKRQLEKQIATYERKIKENKSPARKKADPNTPELAALNNRLRELKKEYNDVQNKSYLDVLQDNALEAFKDKLNKKKSELEDKLNKKDFAETPSSAPIFALDPEALKLTKEVKKVQDKYDIERKKAMLANRNRLQKSLDWIGKWRRFALLSGVKTLGKLQSAAMFRYAISSPLEELYGAAISHIPGISSIADKAPREGGISFKGEAKAISQIWQKATYQDMRDIVKDGKGSLDLLYGKNNELPPEALDFFGQLHSALKATPKRAEFFRSFEKRLEFAASKGVDITDPVVQATIGSQAYIDANRAIFMQDNPLTDLYQKGIRYLAGKGTGGEITAAGLKFLLPIVKVPTNFAGEVTSYAGGVLKAAVALRKGIKSLTPEQADYVMRNLKKGSIGLAVLAVGYFNPQNAGGYYQPFEKRKKDDVEAGQLELFGVKLPKWIGHAPMLEMLQLGSTLRRVHDKSLQKKKDEFGARWESLHAGVAGIMSEVPFFEEPGRLGEALGNSRQAEYQGAELLKSFIEPRILQEGAELMDYGNKRKMTTLKDHLKSGIPGLREDLKKK